MATETKTVEVPAADFDELYRAVLRLHSFSELLKRVATEGAVPDSSFFSMSQVLDGLIEPMHDLFWGEKDLSRLCNRNNDDD